MNAFGDFNNSECALRTSSKIYISLHISCQKKVFFFICERFVFWGILEKASQRCFIEHMLGGNWKNRATPCVICRKYWKETLATKISCTLFWQKNDHFCWCHFVTKSTHTVHTPSVFSRGKKYITNTKIFFHPCFSSNFRYFLANIERKNTRT